jgi:ribonuclease BN (tRNA processing enzyme)
MRLTVLGGSAAGPNPGQGCSGYLVESGQTQVVLDLGPGTLPELRLHVDFREIDGIVLSHMHLDHTLDILALRYALAYNPVPPTKRMPLWLPPGGLAFFDRLGSVLADAKCEEDFFAVFEPQEYDPNRALSIRELTFTFSRTVHYVPCWAIRAANGVDGDLFYTADTGPSANMVTAARDAHVVVAEGTERGQSREPFETRGHLTPSEAGRIARDAGASLLVLTHLWGEDDPFSAVAEAEAAFGGQVRLATPGYRLVWTGKDGRAPAHPW